MIIIQKIIKNNVLFKKIENKKLKNKKKKKEREIIHNNKIYKCFILLK